MENSIKLCSNCVFKYSCNRENNRQSQFCSADSKMITSSALWSKNDNLASQRIKSVLFMVVQQPFSAWTSSQLSNEKHSFHSDNIFAPNSLRENGSTWITNNPFYSITSAKVGILKNYRRSHRRRGFLLPIHDHLWIWSNRATAYTGYFNGRIFIQISTNPESMNPRLLCDLYEPWTCIFHPLT